MLKKGLVQIYTGDGKGKTTAALGLALRAAGQGNKVLFFQFLKPANLKTGERISLEKFKSKIKIQALDFNWLMSGLKNAKQKSDAKKIISEAVAKLTKSAEKKIYDLIILDEMVFCLSQKLIELEDIKNLLQKKNKYVEIILTGRGATRELIKLADLVTEMKCIKHPFDKGVKARRGIEF